MKGKELNLKNSGMNSMKETGFNQKNPWKEI
jgi:hypothetical protein